MKATQLRKYRRQGDGEMIYVYGLSGTEAEIAAHKLAKETEAKTNPTAKYLIDETTKLPLLFSKNNWGQNADVIINKKGEYRVVNLEMQEIAELQKQGLSYEHAKDIVKNKAV